MLAHVEHRDDARMLPRRGDLALPPQETLAEPGVRLRASGVEHLERHGQSKVGL